MKTSQKDTALIIGAGSFGTSMATVLANNFKTVILLVRSHDVYQSIKDKKENSVYLPGAKLSSNIIPAKDWQEVNHIGKNNISLIIFGLPTEAIRPFLKENHFTIGEYLKKNIPIVSLAKGIDSQTLELPDDLFFDFFPEYKELMAFLSGPSFAREIVSEQITLVSLAGRSRSNLVTLSEQLETAYFKALPSYDIKGILLGGALKNVLAIAGGILEGLGHNHNTRAAMITRGIAEMLRYGKVFNARPETFYGLSGMGDLILTTTGDTSRNKQFGLEIAKGRDPIEIMKNQRTVVEGYKTAQAAHLLGQKYEIRANIFNGVYRVLYEKASPQNVIKELMNTPTKFELE